MFRRQSVKSHHRGGKCHQLTGRVPFPPLRIFRPCGGDGAAAVGADTAIACTDTGTGGGAAPDPFSLFDLAAFAFIFIRQV